MSNTWILQASAELAYDGDAATITEVADNAVIVRTRAGRIRRLRLVEVLFPSSEGGLAHIFVLTRAEEKAVPLGMK